ncbi:hypothetical protein TUMEXPCC7403_10075 [Tumidithrix helvetica PCC 7403]
MHHPYLSGITLNRIKLKTENKPEYKNDVKPSGLDHNSSSSLRFFDDAVY